MLSFILKQPSQCVVIVCAALGGLSLLAFIIFISFSAKLFFFFDVRFSTFAEFRVVITVVRFIVCVPYLTDT